jgi:hypothetical protein
MASEVDYEFFHSLTAEAAQTYLDRFLEVEREAVNGLVPVAAKEGCNMDYSLQTLGDFLKWMVKKVRVDRVPVPDEVPSWIRQAHPDGLTEFDEDSKTIILRAGYYLGECFARLPGLRWATGDPEYMEKHMPVVAGFRHGLELPPLVVVKNMFARIVGSGCPITEIDSTIEIWARDCPHAAS